MGFEKGRAKTGGRKKQVRADVVIPKPKPHVPYEAKPEAPPIVAVAVQPIETRATVVVQEGGRFHEQLSADLWGQLERLGYNPFLVMAELSHDEAQPPQVRAKAANDLAAFLLPRKKSIEHSGVVGTVTMNADDLQQALVDRLLGIRTRTGSARRVGAEPKPAGNL